MFNLSRAVFCILGVTLAVATAHGQNLYEVETRPVRGFMPNMDQLSSPADHIDPVSRKLHLEIPLASLPRGRAGSGFDLNLVYDSHQWDLMPDVSNPPDPYNQTYGPAAVHKLNQQWLNFGGWNLNIDNIGLDYEEKISTTEYSPQCSDPGPWRLFRLRVRLLDGSWHVMHLKGYGHELGDGYSGDGFFPINPGGRTYCFIEQSPGYQQLHTGWLTYYSNDGSYLKLEMYADGSGNWGQFHLYFPDGRRVSRVDGGVQELYDPNGNRVRVIAACYDFPTCNQPYKAIVDDTDPGREIRFSSSGEVWNELTTTITAEGPGGPMTWTLNWEALQLGLDGRQYLTADFYEAPWGPTFPLNSVLLKLKYIQLPLAPAVPANQQPPIWNSYVFGYSDDADDGFGELDYMRTPTGATFHYRYTHEAAPGLTAKAIAHENTVTQRKVTQDGQPDLVWTYAGAYNPTGGATVVTAPDSSQTMYWYGPTGNYLDSSIPLNAGVGMVVYKIEEPNGTVRKRLWSQNRVVPSNPTQNNYAHNPWVKREMVTVGNAAGSPTLTAVTDRVIDKNGNLLETTEYDWVSFNSSGPEEGATPRRNTQFTYYATVPNYQGTTDDPEAYWNPHVSPLQPMQPRRLDALRRKEVRDGNGVIAAVTEFDYDDEFRAGNVEAEMRWDSVKSASPPGLGQLNASNSQVLTRDYDAYGNLTDILVPEVRTHITYDAQGNHPTRVDYAYQTADQRSRSYAWHAPSGALTSKTDLDNNLTTAYTYDVAGRQLTVNEAGVRKTETIYDDENRRVTVKKDLIAFGDGKLQALTEYDQLGRSIRTVASEPGNPNGIQTKTTYYPLTNRTVQSSPHRTTADPTLEWTCTQKDASGRVTAVALFKGAAEPDDCEPTSNRTGITRTAYDTNWTQLTDPAGKVHVESRDVFGRLVQVIEDPGDPQAGKLDYHTYYAYDTLDNLTQVSQGVQTRTFGYSSLGRLLSAANPENGTTNYAYNDSGDLLTRSDARGIVATLAYDNMHRIVTKSYTADPQATPPVPPTPSVTYSYYTTGSPNAGQLQSVTSSAATTQHTSYDVLGRVTGSTHTVSGYTNPQSFAYTYWLSDAVKSLQYPSGRIVNYDVDDAGRTAKVRDAGTTFADLTGIASAAAFTADGRMTAVKLGNELWETRNYQTPGIPTKYRVGTTDGGAEMLELEYNFSGTANDGNLLSHIIRVPETPTTTRTWSQGYRYDAVNRLLCAAESASLPANPCTEGQWRQTFGYDLYGNRWVAFEDGLTGTDTHQPTASTNFDPNTNRLYIQNSDYDAAGNQTFYTPYTLGYDGENRNVSLTSPSNGSGTFAYDGDGKRVKKTWTNSSGTTTTYYFRNALGQLAVEYSSELSANPGRIYVHTDMLGSTRLVTSDKPPTGPASILECYDYVPFGRILNSGDPDVGANQRNTGCHQPNPDYVISSRIAQKFTGKERDTETRLDFFGARYYSGGQGRFISADTPFADQRSEDPQSWNLYAYVRNNPLSFVDPDGRKRRFFDEFIINSFHNAIGVVKGFMNSDAPVAAIHRLQGMPEQTASNVSQQRGMDVSMDVIEGAAMLIGRGNLGKGTSPAPLTPSIPNRYGRNGGPLHQAEIQKVETGIVERGLTPQREARIVTPGGHKNTRYADIVGKDVDGNIVEIHQVGRQTKRGLPVSRERKAIEDIEKARIQKVEFHPYAP